MSFGFRDMEAGIIFPAYDQKAFELQYTPSQASLEEALRTLILSASGWRKVYAADGNEESVSTQISPADQVLCAAMAWTFFHFVQKTVTGVPRICVGLDSRYTGPVIADIMMRIFLSLGAEVEYLGIVAAPEIMGYVQKSRRFDAFAYVSASHNPVGHNGIKWGLSGGGVVGGSDAQVLISTFRTEATNVDHAKNLLRLLHSASQSALVSIYQDVQAARKRSSQSYWELCDEILTLESSTRKQKDLKDTLRTQIKSARLGVVAEFNGSARGISIDKDYLEDLGVGILTLNDRPRQFVHKIIPEGPSLDPCKNELSNAHVHDSSFVLGYVPDCDGDRGNVVYWDDRAMQAKTLEAQEVFSLCVLSELAGLVQNGHLTYDEDGHPNERVAVVCNDPTSLRIERIASAFGAHVFRAEVGEANVVSLARKLRGEGWNVRILGEGSNGGNITHPGCVRDPLSTLGSLIKLVTLREKQSGYFWTWLERIGKQDAYRPDFSLTDVLETIPPFVTTATSNERAILKITSQSHAHLKSAYEKHFLAKGWKENAETLREKLGIWAWEEVNYEGIEERRGFGPPFRSGKETGGFKILLKDQKGRVVGAIWMRGSGTEPVFRVLAEIEGKDAWKEQWLLDWHVAMLRAVD